MAELRKGTVTQVLDNGARAIIRPLGGGASLTPPLPVQAIKIPQQEEIVTVLHPGLVVGDNVAFVLFEDGTGRIFDKA